MTNEHSQTASFEALKVLYEARLATLRTLSERSFSTTLQALTFNVAIVAGLIGSKASLSADGKAISTWLVVVFHALIVSYLISKARAHHRERVKLGRLEHAIASVAGMRPEFIKDQQPSFFRAYFGGSGIFTLAVILAGLCSVLAIHKQLLL